MKQQIAQLQERYAALEPRERRLVIAGALVLVVLVYYLALLEPLMNARSAAADRLAAEQALATQLVQARAELGQQRSTGSSRRSSARPRSLLAVVDQTGKAAGLGDGMRRVQPEGDKRVRVWLEDVAFNDTIRWLDRIKRTDGLTVDTADISAASEPGKVEARLGLTR